MSSLCGNEKRGGENVPLFLCFSIEKQAVNVLFVLRIKEKKREKEKKKKEQFRR